MRTLCVVSGGGIERMMPKGDGKGYESVVTIGMRGDGDEAMARGTAAELLERIVHDQRAIIADVTGRTAAQQPQVWALYKGVQDYYDKGMQVPDDVILLFADESTQIRPFDALLTNGRKVPRCRVRLQAARAQRRPFTSFGANIRV